MEKIEFKKYDYVCVKYTNEKGIISRIDELNIFVKLEKDIEKYGWDKAEETKFYFKSLIKFYK